MAFRTNTTTTKPRCSVACLFLAFTLLCVLPISLFLFISNTSPTRKHDSTSQIFHNSLRSTRDFINVYVAELPRSLNYDLLNKYWSSDPDSRIPTDPDHPTPPRNVPKPTKFPSYPENPLIKQYSAEYWILGDLETPLNQRTSSFAKRVFIEREADVIFVPFFATLSTEMQLGTGKGAFRKKAKNDDYQRQREVMDFVKNTESWKRSGGRDHVFVLTDPVAMWHVRAEIAQSILLVVDFGGWYRLDSRSSNGSSCNMIQHTQVSLLKDVIVPYTHLLPRLHLSKDEKRQTLLYFKGAKHRQRGGVIREKLWDLLVNEAGVVMEEGFPNATGREQSIKGMRSSEFCLHPAGDTPTSCRIFDAIQSLCIPVIVSDNIELPFEGMVDYSEFSVFMAVDDALRPNRLVSHLRSIPEKQKEDFRHKMAAYQTFFEYDNSFPGGIGPIPVDGAVNHIWKKVSQKMPMIRESIVREKRKPSGVSVPLRCHCT